MSDLLEDAAVTRRAHNVDGIAFGEVRIKIGKDEHVTAAGAHFLHVRIHAFQKPIIWRDEGGRHAAIEQ